MGRRKELLSEETLKNIESDLQSIPNNVLLFRLTALKAASNNKHEDVAKIFNISRSTIQRWASSYTAKGVEGLKVKPKGHNPSKLSLEEQEIIKSWILDCIDHNGNNVHWTLHRLKKEILTVFNKEVGKTPLWMLLKRMGLSLKKPRPKHYKSDESKQASFKKNSNND